MDMDAALLRLGASAVERTGKVKRRWAVVDFVRLYGDGF